MTKKYALIRKSDKVVGEKKERKWVMCHIYTYSPAYRRIRGGFTGDKSIVEENKTILEKWYPNEKYAILEMEE